MDAPEPTSAATYGPYACTGTVSSHFSDWGSFLSSGSDRQCNPQLVAPCLQRMSVAYAHVRMRACEQQAI